MGTRGGKRVGSSRKDDESPIVRSPMRRAVSTFNDFRRQSVPLTSLAEAAKSTLLQPIEVAPNPEQQLIPGQKGRWYGTRVSTIILVRDDGSTTFVEKTRAVLVDGQVKAGSQRRFDFTPR